MKEHRSSWKTPCRFGCESSVQPSFRDEPFACDSRSRDCQQIRNLAFRQSAEVSKFHDLGLLRIHHCEFVERLVQQQEFAVGRLCSADALIQRHSYRVAETL